MPDYEAGSKSMSLTPRQLALALRALQVLFWLTVAFTFVEATIPPRQAIELFPWDKAEHFAAFFVLTGMCAVAYPRAGLLMIGALLSAFGALIEIVQGFAIIGRDRDFWDWVADTVAICAAIAPMLVTRWRMEAQRRMAP